MVELISNDEICHSYGLEARNMQTSKQRQELHHSASMEHIKAIQRSAYKERRKSPTIAEIAAITGHTEEYILESMEFGQSSHFTQPYLH